MLVIRLSCAMQFGFGSEMFDIAHVLRCYFVRVVKTRTKEHGNEMQFTYLHFAPNKKCFSSPAQKSASENTALVFKVIRNSEQSFFILQYMNLVRIRKLFF